MVGGRSGVLLSLGNVDYIITAVLTCACEVLLQAQCNLTAQCCTSRVLGEEMEMTMDVGLNVNIMLLKYRK